MHEDIIDVLRRDLRDSLTASLSLFDRLEKTKYALLEILKNTTDPQARVIADRVLSEDYKISTAMVAEIEHELSFGQPKKERPN